MKFVDLDKEICDLIRQEIPQLEVINNSLDNVEGDIISTASNPMFTFGSGLDRYLDKRFNLKQQESTSSFRILKGDKKIKHVFLNITVDENIKSNKELIYKAYDEYIKYCKDFRLEPILTAFGTGIGGFDKKEMVEILKKVINEYGTYISKRL